MNRTMLPLFLLVSATAVSQNSVPNQQPYVDLVNANTRFAFKVFHQSVVKSPETNVLVSPAALSFDFALLQNGADPATRDQIASVFEFGHLSAEAINRQSFALRRALIYDPPQERSSVAHERGMQPPRMCCEHLTLAGSHAILYMGAINDPKPLRPIP